MKITPSYLYLSLLLCLLSYAPLDAQEAFNDSVALIKRNYINATVGKDKGKEVLLRQLSTIPPEKEASDQNVIELQQLYPISPKEIKHLINTLHTDGSWEDINYADTKRSGWEPKKHTERILKLTKYHYQKKQILKPSERARLTNAIHQAMNFWFSRKLVCKNWWYNQIGIPRTLGPAFLLFEQEMSEPEKQGAIKVMMNSSFGMTGQNKVWLAGNVLIRALLQNDWQLAKEARKVIASEITLGQKEGIKADWSFHQHGPQQQFGNYGLSFICNMSFYSELFTGTTLAFSQEQQRILTSLLLEGYQWIIWRGYWDVNALNRQLFRNADIDKGFSLLFAAHSLMKSSEPEVADQIKKMILRNSSFSQVPNSFTGNKHFRESDYTVHRTPTWLASVRMASERVIGTELVNEDNLKGYYMADGALYTYVYGDEYHNIFPFWNWRRIPGITTYDERPPQPAGVLLTMQSVPCPSRGNAVRISTIQAIPTIHKRDDNERRQEERQAEQDGQTVRSDDVAWRHRAQPHLAAANGHVFRIGAGRQAHAIPLPALRFARDERLRHDHHGSDRRRAGRPHFAVRSGIVG